MGVQVSFVRPGSTHRTIKHFHILNMNFITFFLPILLVATAVQAKTFAEKLAVFIGDTPAGYTVTQMVKDGENCHCRVPGSSSSSSSQFVPTVAGSSSAVTTAQLTTEADTTTDATTATTETTTATTATTATTFNTASAGSAAADSDTGPGSALTADFDTGSAAGR